MVTDLGGAIAADSEQGVFASDTRFVSYYGMFANGKRWVRLASAATASHSARITLTNPTFPTEEGEIRQGALALVMTRAVSEGIHEDLDVTNYGLVAVQFNLEIALRSDFADLFEVKSHAFVRRGHIVTAWDEKTGELRTSYSHRDFRRQFVYRVTRTTARPAYANGRISFAIALGPGATWHACAEYVLMHGARTRAPARDCHDEFASPEFDVLQREWLTQATALTSANEDVYRLFRQSTEDMGALRLYDHDVAHDVWLPAAGVPWFVTIFGRDSLIVSLQNMLVNPTFARGSPQEARRVSGHGARRLARWRAGQDPA